MKAIYILNRICKFLCMYIDFIESRFYKMQQKSSGSNRKIIYTLIPLISIFIN